MPVRSPLNPEAITGNPPASLESFQNFISGGSSVGQSTVSASGQQDIGFQRASVKAVNPDISSIVNTISSNIQNELNSTLQNVTNIVNRNVSDKIKDNNKLIIRQIGNIVERKDSSITNLQNSVRNITQENNKLVQNVTGDLQRQIDLVKESKSNTTLGGDLGSYNVMNEVQQLVDKSTNITNRSVDRKIKDVGTGLSTQIQQVRQSQGSQVTQVQNSLQNVRQETNNIVQKLTGDYQKKIKDIDAAKPTNILDKFLDTYNNALGFLQFFANKKNVDGLRKNLKNLVTSFTESFEVAKLVRQTLFKIVGQLSNLPKASPGRGSGINLDVRMPRKGPNAAKPRGGRVGGLMRRMALPALGVGALAVGGAATVNALENKPQIQKEDNKFNFLDSLKGIVDGFAGTIFGFLNEDKNDDDPKPSGPQPVSRPSGDTTGSTVAGENLAAVTSTLEATGLQNQADVMQVALNRVNNPLTPYGDLFGQMTEREQFSPISSMIYDIPSEDPDAERVYGPIKAKLGKTPEERIKKIKELSSGTDGIQNFADFIGRPEIAAPASNVLKQFKNDTAVAAQSRDFVGDLISFRGYAGRGKRRGPGGNYLFDSGGKIGKLPVAKIDPNAKGGFELDPRGLQRSPEQIEAISKPIPSGSGSGSSSVVPLDLSGAAPQQQASGGGSPTILAGKNEGPTVPQLASGDSENFLTMYSKLTYNIVDG